MEEALEFFRDNGFYVQRGALSPAEVAAAREGMAVVARAHLAGGPLHAACMGTGIHKYT